MSKKKVKKKNSQLKQQREHLIHRRDGVNIIRLSAPLIVFEFEEIINSCKEKIKVD